MDYRSRMERAKDSVLMLSLNETADQLAMANSVCWYGHVLRRALDFEVECQRKKGSWRGHGNRWREKV